MCGTMMLEDMPLSLGRRVSCFEYYVIGLSFLLPTSMKGGNNRRP